MSSLIFLHSFTASVSRESELELENFTPCSGSSGVDEDGDGVFLSCNYKIIRYLYTSKCHAIGTSANLWCFAAASFHSRS